MQTVDQIIATPHTSSGLFHFPPEVLRMGIPTSLAYWQGISIMEGGKARDEGIAQALAMRNRVARWVHTLVGSIGKREERSR